MTGGPASIAIVKPDHLGDLILASAAVNALMARYPEAWLFVAPKNVPLARLLFPQAFRIEPITRSHLEKGREVAEVIPDLSIFDLVIFLRQDELMSDEWASSLCRDFIFPQGGWDKHQVLLDYEAVHPLIGDYDADRAFFGSRLDKVEGKVGGPPKQVGLSLGTGFYANAWPVTRWIDLGIALKQSGAAVTLICGPAEVALGKLLAQSLELPAEDVILCHLDIVGALQRIDGLDLVIAADGGTAHFCSLVTPIISIFGPSPFRRYAPFGAHNMLLTLDLPCSPCCQYHWSMVNCCLTQECVSAISAADVMASIDIMARRQLLPGEKIMVKGGLTLHAGISHSAGRYGGLQQGTGHAA